MYLASETTRISFSVKAKSYLEASKKLFTIHITLVKKNRLWETMGKYYLRHLCPFHGSDNLANLSELFRVVVLLIRTNMITIVI